MTINQIFDCSGRQVFLDAAKEAFFAAGGSVQVLPGCSFSLPPARKHPQPVIKIAPAPPLPEKEKVRACTAMTKRNDRIAELAETMTCNQVAEEMGISAKSIRDIGWRMGIKFLPDTSGRKPRPMSEFTAMAERIGALAKIGVSKVRAAKHLGITPRLLSRIANAFGIAFSTCEPASK